LLVELKIGDNLGTEDDVTKAQNVKRDDSKTLFNHCLLHEKRGLGVKVNAKTAFKMQHLYAPCHK